MNALLNDLPALNERFEGEGPEHILAFALERLSPHVAVATSLSADDTVVMHMVSQIDAGVPFVFIDTGHQFPETLALADVIEAYFANRLVRLHPTVAHDKYSCGHPQCCQMRKVEPLRRGFRGLALEGWITGLRRDQAATRADTRIFERTEWDPGRPMVKVNPLVRWRREEVWAYVVRHGLPYNPLYDHGYASIGCAPMTAPVAAGQHEREGRWAGLAKTECGLHTFGKDAERADGSEGGEV